MRIIIKNLSFSYGRDKHTKVTAIDNLSLTIEEGEFFGIIGQTGSGKSTLIQHLNALIPLQQGQIFVGNFDLSEPPKKLKPQLKELRSKVGMVFQYPEYQLFAETVFDDVAFGIKNFFPDLSKEQTEQKVRSALETVGLDFDKISQKSPFELSGGQKRRVAIAGVLVTDPEILVLDEPVAGLDPAGKIELMKLLHSLENGKRTIIIVSHDMDEVCENCSRIAVMSHGKIIATGTSEEIFSNREVLGDKLDMPVTAYLKEKLIENGVSVSGSLKTQDFIENTAKLFK